MTIAPTEAKVVLSWREVKDHVWEAEHRGHTLVIRHQVAPEKGYVVAIDGRYMGQRSDLITAKQWASLLVD